MNLSPTKIVNPVYERFKKWVNTFEKPGYYIIDFASIKDLRADGKSTTEIVRALNEYFVQKGWLRSRSVLDQGPWADWEEVSEAYAARRMTSALKGGAMYGRAGDDIDPRDTQKVWSEFMLFFARERTLYEVFLYKEELTFYEGILVIDKDKAGVFNVVQDD